MDDRQETGSSETAGRNRYPRLNVSQGEYSPMLKPLTLSLSLAVALGFCSVSMAGGHDDCTTCGLASPQGGPIASAQCPIATCDTHCAPKCSLFSGLGCHFSSLHCQLQSLCHPPVCYEWVLKKKRLWGCHGGCGELRDLRLLLRSMRPARLLPRARVAMPLPRARGYAAPQAAPVYRCWPAHLPGCEACPDHRLGSCRDDPGHRG